jgi:hypothetical protein
MSENTPSPAGAASADLTSALQQAERELAALKVKLRSSSRLTGIVGLVILALLSGYFYYGYTEINSLLQPKQIVNAASDFIDQQLPEIRQQLESQIKNNSGEWMQTASDEALNAIPQLRAAIEDFAIDHMNEVMDQVATITEDEFRKFITDNRELVETTFKELADNPKVSDELLKQLEAALDQQLGVEMKSQAEDLLDLLAKLADEVESLREGKNLGELERKKRSILMIARRLQHDQALTSEGDDLEMLKPLQEAVKGAAAEKDAG